MYYEISTDRLFLRTPAETDAPLIKNFHNDEFATDNDALKWIRWVNSDDRNRLIFVFYIWLKQTDQLIGRVYIHSKPELDGDVEIGYSISEKQRNKGHATEAAQAIVRFAFERAGQEVLSAIVKPENIASRRVIEKLGFTYNGVRNVWDNGEFCEFDYFTLCRTVLLNPQKYTDAPCP